MLPQQLSFLSCLIHRETQEIKNLIPSFKIQLSHTAQFLKQFPPEFLRRLSGSLEQKDIQFNVVQHCKVIEKGSIYHKVCKSPVFSRDCPPMDQNSQYHHYFRNLLSWWVDDLWGFMKKNSLDVATGEGPPRSPPLLEKSSLTLPCLLSHAYL